MIIALDVQYDDAHSRARAAAVLFEEWGDARVHDEHTVIVDHVAPYVPGEFFRRELPCLLAILKKIVLPLEAIVVDSYVSLGARPGLGRHLFDALSARVPVIGVAKTRFREAHAIEILRGDSRLPLFITAIGAQPGDAAEYIRRMHGPYRIPTLLKRVDQLARHFNA